MDKEQLIADIKAMSVLELSELVKALEEEFGVSIPDDEVKNLKTVRDAVTYITSAQA